MYQLPAFCSQQILTISQSQNITLTLTLTLTISITRKQTPYPNQFEITLWLNTVRGVLEQLLVYDPQFNSQSWPSNLGHHHHHPQTNSNKTSGLPLDQDHVRVFFEINFSDIKERGLNSVLHNL